MTYVQFIMGFNTEAAMLKALAEFTGTDESGQLVLMSGPDHDVIDQPGAQVDTGKTETGDGIEQPVMTPATKRHVVVASRDPEQQRHLAGIAAKNPPEQGIRASMFAGVPAGQA